MRSGPDQFSPIRRAAKTVHRALSRCQPSGLREGLLFWLLFWGGMVYTPMAQAEEAGFLDALIDDRSNVMVVLDASGSMGQDWTQGETKFETARRAVATATQDLPDMARSGAVTFGHRRNFDCSDIEVLSNPTASYGDLTRTLEAESPQQRGMRPLADAIETAAARLSQHDGPGAIVVLTDGAEECGGNACALSAPLAQLQIPVHLIGVGMDAADAALLRCLPASAGGSFVIARPGEDLAPLVAKAMALSHTTNAQRSAASIARLLLQEQDIAVRDLTRIRSDLTRLDGAFMVLNQRVESFEGRDLLTEELQVGDKPPVDQEVAMIREAANRLRDQLGSRDQMLIRMQDQTEGWNAGTLGMSRHARLAAAMATLSATVTEPAEKLVEGHQKLVERRATLETEMAATASQSEALHGRLSQLQGSLDQVLLRVESTRHLAASLEAGQPVTNAVHNTLDAPHQRVFSIIESRDAQIATMQQERTELMDELKAVRADLMTAQEDVVRTQRQRVDAEQRVTDARTLLAGLQANQLAMKSQWKTELDRVSLEHLTARQALEVELAEVLAQRDSLRTDLNTLRQTLETSQAQTLRLVVSRDESRAEAAEIKLVVAQLETENSALNQSLTQCRLGQEDLTLHVASLEAQSKLQAQSEDEDLNADPAVTSPHARLKEPDTVHFVLAPGATLDPRIVPQWSVEDAATNAPLSKGQSQSLVLPTAAGVYRVIADLGGQLVERTFDVAPLEQSNHEFSLDLTRLTLSLNPTKTTVAATEPLLVRLSSPVYAVEAEVGAVEAVDLFVPAATYALSATIGLTPWQDELTLIAGETVSHVIDIGALPVAFDLITGDAGEPLSEDLNWVLRDARIPEQHIAQQGPQADLRVAPGIYDIEVAFEGFTATQTVFIDAEEPVAASVPETVRFNDGAVRLRFANNGEAVPEGLDLRWRIELEGAAIVTSQTLEGDIVQLPAGGYRLLAQANDVAIERDFLVLAGQVTELAPDFNLGQVSLSLLDETGATMEALIVDWSVIPQTTADLATGFQGALRSGPATQTLLLPEGRYRVIAQWGSARGSATVQRLIAVKSGDRAAFGLMVPQVQTGAAADPSAEPPSQESAQLSSDPAENDDLAQLKNEP